MHLHRGHQFSSSLFCSSDFRREVGESIPALIPSLKEGVFSRDLDKVKKSLELRLVFIKSGFGSFDTFKKKLRLRGYLG